MWFAFDLVRVLYLFTAGHEHQYFAFDVIADEREEKGELVWQFTNTVALQNNITTTRWITSDAWNKSFADTSVELLKIEEFRFSSIYSACNQVYNRQSRHKLAYAASRLKLA